MILQKTKTLKNINQNQMIMEFTPLIKLIAKKMLIKVNYKIEESEFVNLGVLGLIDAISKFDFSKENQFKTYAEFRIRGAMLDYLREIDIVPRSVRDRAKNIDKHAKILEFELKRKPSEIELAKALKMNINEYNHYRNLSITNTFQGIEDFNINEKVISINKLNNPENSYQKKNLIKTISTALKDLDRVESQVVSLYYFEDLNLKEIKEVLNLSISRISQIHSNAIKKLKINLKKEKEELFQLIS